MSKKVNNVKFSNYFNDWLYGENGYYSNYKTIGKDGDFYTAVSSSRFFGGSIGKKAVDTIDSGFLPENTTILEIGAHHGYLLADMIEFIYTLDSKLIGSLKFAIVERYEHLRIKQQEYFKASFGDAIEIIHYNDISEVKLDTAFVVANEIFDAFACDLVYTNDKDILQYAVVDKEKNKIEFVDNDDENIKNHCEKYHITKGEIPVGYKEFTQNLSKNIDKFEFITFDYGEKYPRNDFSARVYFKHNVFPIFDEKMNLEQFFGLSDITYDVHFDYLIDCFKDLGVSDINYETQLKAMVSFGIVELLEMLHKNVDEETYLHEANKAKTLLNPTGMGDRFKMLNIRQGLVAVKQKLIYT